MIPEHVQALREWVFHDKNDEEKPDLASDQLDEMDRIIRDALESGRKVAICFYDHIQRRKQKVIGTIKKIDPLRRTIQFITGDSSSRQIDIHDILEIDGDTP